MKTMIRGLSVAEYMDRAKGFHGGHLAPGMIIAGFMVDLACRNIPEDTLFEVICESSACMPDAVQLLTPCTVGNQWLKIIDAGRYAMVFYDKYTGEGVRVNLDVEKLKRYPAIVEWHLKLKPKQDQDKDALIAEILRAGDDILSIRRIEVSADYLGKTPKTIGICPVCGETYRSSEGAICPACKGNLMPYALLPDKIETPR